MFYPSMNENKSECPTSAKDTINQIIQLRFKG